MKKILFRILTIAALVSAVPAYAVEAVGGGTLSIIEYSVLPENRGLSQKIVNQKYDAYRHGLLPVTTLETSSMR